MFEQHLTWPGDGHIPKGDPSCWYRADLPYGADNVVYNAFSVVKETGATVWIATDRYEACPEEGRKVGKAWKRRWAAPTPGGALLDLKARRKKQFDILLRQLDDCVAANRRLGQDFKGAHSLSRSQVTIGEREALNFLVTDAPDEIERLREALKWCGENARLARLIHSEGDKGRHALQDDGGYRARAALAPRETADD